MEEREIADQINGIVEATFKKVPLSNVEQNFRRRQLNQPPRVRGYLFHIDWERGNGSDVTQREKMWVQNKLDEIINYLNQGGGDAPK